MSEIQEKQLMMVMMTAVLEVLSARPVRVGILAALLACPTAAQALPEASVDVLTVFTPSTGPENRDQDGATTPDGTVFRDASGLDATDRLAEAIASTEGRGTAGAFSRVGVPAFPGGPGEMGDVHRAESTAAYTINWEVTSDTLDDGTPLANTFIDLTIEGAFSLDFRPDQQPNFDFGFWDFGDEASMEDSLVSRETVDIELSTPSNDPFDPTVLFSFSASMDDSGDISVSDGASYGITFSDAASEQRSDGTATYSQAVDQTVSILVPGEFAVGDRFEISLSLATLAEMVGITAFDSGERFVATATADFLNTASYTLGTDTPGVDFVAIPIPEPGLSTLLGLGLAALSIRRRP